MTSTRHSRARSVDQCIERRLVECVRSRIERHRDAGLRGGHEVDRQAVLLEHRERIGEKADRVPHPDGFHRDQRDVLLDRDRLHLRGDVAAVRGDDGAFELRRLRRVDVQRDAVLLHGHDAAGMQHLRAAAGDFLRLVVLERAQQPRRRHRARIRAEHARHVGPDLQPARLQLRREVAGRSVGTAATEQHGVAGLVAGDETL